MKQRYFTIIELLAVIAILFVMAGMVLGIAAGVSRARNAGATKAKLEKMMLALQEHFQDRGFYPMQAAGDANFSPFKNSQTGRPYLEGYEEGTDYMDGWHHPFQYKYQSGDTTYKLWSMGSDGVSGTDDDICSWKQR